MVLAHVPNSRSNFVAVCVFFNFLLVGGLLAVTVNKLKKAAVHTN